jgi:ABC-type sugar transport system ATPase subunit
MNFLTGTVASDGGSVRLKIDSLDIALAGRVAETARARGNGSTLTIGMRPEHFDTAPAGAADTIRVPAGVDVVEFLGNDDLIHTTVAGKDVVAMVPSARGVKVGDQLELHVLASLVHAFDPQTELALTGSDGAKKTPPRAVSTEAAAPAAGTD